MQPGSSPVVPTEVAQNYGGRLRIAQREKFAMILYEPEIRTPRQRRSPAANCDAQVRGVRVSIIRTIEEQ